MRMGAWSMARVLRQRIEYYIYILTYPYLLSLHPLSFHEMIFYFTSFILESSYMAISADMCICNKKNALLVIKHVCTADQL